MEEKVFFGFEEVDKRSKQSLVNRVFSNVSSKYDIMNDVMSFGVHRHWKNILIDEIADLSKKIIDVAGGTADISMRIHERSKKLRLESDITILDINIDMLKAGKDKLLDNGIVNCIDFICADAENIPFADGVFDYYICAFGIRNMTNLDAVLKEAYRVLKSGGKFICLEFSHVSNDFLSKIYDIYSMYLIPLFGEYIAKDRHSYQYLVESIRKFPSQSVFSKMLEDAKFTNVRYKNLTYGVCAIHTGYK